MRPPVAAPSGFPAGPPRAGGSAGRVPARPGLDPPRRRPLIRGSMDFRAFEARARGLWDEIPEEYRAGVDGLTVSRERLSRPDTPGVFTLGECLTESYPSDWEGPETLRSRLVLYHGSFRALAARNPSFDWEDELWETLTHELRHHLESLAAEDALEGVDYAADQEFRRFDGQAFEPFYYRSGEAVGDGWWAIERSRYLELPWPESSGARFRVGATGYEVAVPDVATDVAYLDVVEGLPEDAEFDVTVVLVRRRSRWQGLKRLLRGRPPRVVELEAVARVVEGTSP